MLWMLIACTVGSSGPATPESTAAIEAGAMADVAHRAETIANRSREIEAATAAARESVAAGADKRTEQVKIEALMSEVEALNNQLQAGHTALEHRLMRAVQSTADTRK
jgi:hypothetical protein